jgi:hypothetical protein
LPGGSAAKAPADPPIRPAIIPVAAPANSRRVMPAFPELFEGDVVGVKLSDPYISFLI